MLYDKAVVTANSAGGGDVTGTVDFFLCNPSQVTGAAGFEVCASGGTNLSGNPRTLVPIAAPTPPSSSVLSSPGVSANTAGVWCFRAVYTPPLVSDYTGSSDASHGECVTVGKENTTTVTTPSVGSGATVAVGTKVTDHAVVTATTNSDGFPSGTINFFICNPTVVDCQRWHLFGQWDRCRQHPCDRDHTGHRSAFVGSDVHRDHGHERWQVVSGPSTSRVRPMEITTTVRSTPVRRSASSVKDTTGTTSVQTWLPNDSATITSIGGTALNGTLSFTLFGAATAR